jgi:hypothetical protein
MWCVYVNQALNVRTRLMHRVMNNRRSFNRRTLALDDLTVERSQGKIASADLAPVGVTWAIECQI